MEERGRKARKEVLGCHHNRPLIGCLKGIEKGEISLTAIASVRGTKDDLNTIECQL